MNNQSIQRENTTIARMDTTEDIMDMTLLMRNLVGEPDRIVQSRIWMI
jgi:hypothetical protein